jgi:hypothetical protein
VSPLPVSVRPEGVAELTSAKLPATVASRDGHPRDRFLYFFRGPSSTVSTINGVEMFGPDTVRKDQDETPPIPGTPSPVTMFDKRVLQPLSGLVECVKGETGEMLAPDRLGCLVEQGWIPDCGLAGTGAEHGFPGYVPGRVGLFLRLERQEMMTAREFRAFARFEEGLIDARLADAGFYSDDDADIVVRDLTRKIKELEGPGPIYEVKWQSADDPEEELEVISLDERHRRLDDAKAYRAEVLSSPRSGTLDRIRQDALRIRQGADWGLTFTVHSYRAMLATGFSYFVAVQDVEVTFAGYDGCTFSNIDWLATLQKRAATAETEEEDLLPIRLPGVTLDGADISMRACTPGDYAEIWNRFRLDQYLRALAEQSGNKMCARCARPLPTPRRHRMAYCGEKCRSAAKAQGYRERWPERAKHSRNGKLKLLGPIGGTEPDHARH